MYKLSHFDHCTKQYKQEAKRTIHLQRILDQLFDSMGNTKKVIKIIKIGCKYSNID